MRKRVLSLLLAVAMLLPMMPVAASAYSGDIPHVDYTRIDYNTVLETEVLFNIGSHTFKGKLANGNMLDEEEVDQIILEFMQSYNITIGDPEEEILFNVLVDEWEVIEYKNEFDVE